MKVYDRNLTGASAAESGRAQETQKSDRYASSRAGGAGGAAGTDRVELSSTLGRLSKMLSAYGSDRAGKVQALAAQYRSGSYRPNSAAIGSGMVSEALAAGTK